MATKAAESDRNSNPVDTFRKDWAKAREEKDPNAPFCTLVTVSSSDAGDGSTASIAPCSRIVGLREVTDDGGFVLFINSTSPKWKQLQSNNSAYEILVFWPTQMIQYRLNGTRYETIPQLKMKELWDKKPHTSKLLDYYYTNHHPQSSELESRQEFLDGMKQISEQFPPQPPRTSDDDSNANDKNVTVPFQEIATGLILKPDSIEEWRGSTKDRLHFRYRHDRTQSNKESDGSSSWVVTPLVP